MSKSKAKEKERPAMPKGTPANPPAPVDYNGARIYTSFAKRSFRVIMVAGNYSSERGFAWGSAGGGRLSAWRNVLAAVDEARDAGW